MKLNLASKPLEACTVTTNMQILHTDNLLTSDYLLKHTLTNNLTQLTKHNFALTMNTHAATDATELNFREVQPSD